MIEVRLQASATHAHHWALLMKSYVHIYYKHGGLLHWDKCVHRRTSLLWRNYAAEFLQWTSRRICTARRYRTNFTRYRLRRLACNIHLYTNCPNIPTAMNELLSLSWIHIATSRGGPISLLFGLFHSNEQQRSTICAMEPYTNHTITYTLGGQRIYKRADPQLWWIAIETERDSYRAQEIISD